MEIKHHSRGHACNDKQRLSKREKSEKSVHAYHGGPQWKQAQRPYCGCIFDNLFKFVYYSKQMCVFVSFFKI